MTTDASLSGIKAEKWFCRGQILNLIAEVKKKKKKQISHMYVSSPFSCCFFHGLKRRMFFPFHCLISVKSTVRKFVDKDISQLIVFNLLFSKFVEHVISDVLYYHYLRSCFDL